jgi:hypothetical protein
MKQTLLVSIILSVLLLVPVASAFSVKEAFESFYTDAAPSVVIGPQKNADDEYASFAFANEFGVKNYSVAGTKEATQVILGGPCANSLWTSLAGDTCDGWQYGNHTAVIVSVQTASGKSLLLIGGTSGKDTRAAAKDVVTHFADAKYKEGRVVLDTTDLPLAKDLLKVYRAANAVEAGQSSAAGNVIIDTTNSGETLAKELQKYYTANYPLATVQILQPGDVTLDALGGSVLIVIGNNVLISVGKDAPSSHVVLASAAAFWLGGQGLHILPTATHDQLGVEDLTPS